jgi:hypothetical protein
MELQMLDKGYSYVEEIRAREIMVDDDGSWRVGVRCQCTYQFRAKKKWKVEHFRCPAVYIILSGGV